MLSTPLHPLVVHFPIAFLTIGALIQIISTWKKGFIEKTAWWTISLGFVTAIIAYVSGEGAEEYAEGKGTIIHSTLVVHQTLGLISLFIFGLIIGLKVFQLIKPTKFIPYLNLVLAIAGLVTIILTGYYGGKMVYI